LVEDVPGATNRILADASGASIVQNSCQPVLLQQQQQLTQQRQQEPSCLSSSYEGEESAEQSQPAAETEQQPVREQMLQHRKTNSQEYAAVEIRISSAIMVPTEGHKVPAGNGAAEQSATGTTTAAAAAAAVAAAAGEDEWEAANQERLKEVLRLVSTASVP
jgi:hypothetical protein